MIVRMIGGWITTRLGLKGSEFLLLTVGVLTVGVVAGLVKHVEDVRTARYITAQAEKAARQVHQRQEVDVNAVLSWLEQRDEYRRQQGKILDTTFMDYFTFPDPLENVPVPAIFLQGPYGPTNEDVSDAPVPQGVSPRQRRAVANGVWESYCLTVADDPDC